jgi:hypothetical protein
VHKHMRKHESEGQPSRAEMGLGRSAQADRPGPLLGSVRPLFHCTRRIFNPKFVEVPPFAREKEPFVPRGHPQVRERGERSSEENRSTQWKHPQVEKEEDTIGSVIMINGSMSSTLMG